MTRGISGAVDTATKAPHFRCFPMVEMALDGGTVFMCANASDVVYAGHTYTALLGIGEIEPIVETSTDIQGLAFTLSGVPQNMIAIAETTEVQGRSVLVRMAFIDNNNAIQVDDNVWSGYLDQMVIVHQAPTATIRVTAEHKLARWDTPNPRRFSNEDHQTLHPGDKFFEFLPQVAEQTLVWPSRQWFKEHPS